MDFDVLCDPVQRDQKERIGKYEEVREVFLGFLPILGELRTFCREWNIDGTPKCRDVFAALDHWLGLYDFEMVVPFRGEDFDPDSCEIGATTNAYDTNFAGCVAGTIIPGLKQKDRGVIVEAKVILFQPKS